ncbi:hypothetical protein RQP46_002238 [Phenoliferia psychrophenolica]
MAPDATNGPRAPPLTTSTSHSLSHDSDGKGERHSSDSDLEKSLLLLRDDCDPPLPSPASSSSHQHSPPPPPFARHLLIALITLGTFSSLTLPRGALQSRRWATLLPVLHYGALLVLAALLGCYNPKGKLGRARIAQAFSSRDNSDNKRARLLVGGFSAAATLAGIWQARWLDGKLWQALEVFGIPLLILLPAVFSTAATPNAILTATTAAAFLVAFSLLGVPADSAGVAVALAKCALESVRWTLLKLGMAGDRGGQFLVGSGVVALLASTTVFVISLLAPMDPVPRPTPDDILFLSLHSISSVLEHATLLVALHSFPSPLSPASAIFPRNLVLLLLTTLGRQHGRPLVGNWLQMALVLALATHILSHYNASTTPSASPTLRRESLADHTFFFQPHLAWHWIAQARVDLVDADTGFASFGPYMRSNCGNDSRGNGVFPVVKELYNIFAGTLCPPTDQLTAWSGQFVVSKPRILANSYARYSALSSILSAGPSHWIHQMWGPNDSGGPDNPAVGHSLERAWPFIFGCNRPEMAESCTDEGVPTKEGCQCLDY